MRNGHPFLYSPCCSGTYYVVFTVPELRVLPASGAIIEVCCRCHTHLGSFFHHLNLLVMYLGNGKIWEHLPVLGSAHSSCRTGSALAFCSCMHLYGFLHAFQPRDKCLLVVPCTPPFQRNCGQPRQAVVCCSICNLWKKSGPNGLLCWKAQVSGE